MSDHHERPAAGPPRDQASRDVADQRQAAIVAEDIRLLNSLGYGQELLRRMSGFSNFAISFSIICVVSGGITSFSQGFCSVGGAAIGVGWPVCCLLSLCVALAMAQIASAFPTAGGLYHWAAILGGRGWGWLTAWFNLAGLIMALAAINVGTYQFGARALASAWDVHLEDLSPVAAFSLQVAGMLAITCAQALLNHLGIGVTAALTDFSGYWILLMACALTAVMLAHAPAIDPARLVTFANYSGTAGGGIWPSTTSVGWLFLLGFLLPAYTLTGFDASANTSEETVGASHHVPRGIIRSVILSGVAGWAMLSSVVLAAPDLDAAAAQGPDAFFWILGQVLGAPVRIVLLAGIAVAQFFCGLATVTSASRMCYAFARDGGLPWSARLRRVSPRYRTPAVAIWTVALVSVAFVAHTPLYSTIAAACTIFLYISYVIPTTLGLLAYGRSWIHMGPWNMGAMAYRTFSVLSILGCGLFLLIGIQPPNEKNLWIVLFALVATALVWFIYERRHFRGPPHGVLNPSRSLVHEAIEPAAANTV